MRKVGIALLVIGLIGLVVFGFQAMQESESFSFLGIDVALSSANWTPIVFSGIVAVAGMIMTIAGKKR